MYRVALLSFHGCPVARLGEKDTGGMNVYVLQVARRLGLRGICADVYTRYHDPCDPQVIPLGPGARVIHLKAGPYNKGKEGLYRHIPEFISNLYAFQREQGLRYDLVHSHYWMSGRIGMALARRWGVPHVATFHTLAKTKLQARAGEREHHLRASTEKKVMDTAHLLVVCTRQEREDLARLYGAAPFKARVVPAGVDLDLFRPRDRRQARRRLGIREEKVALFVGRVEPLKGIDILLRAAAGLVEGHDLRVVIVGGRPGRDRELERLRRLAGRLGLAARVTFTGAVPQGELPWYYSAADVFVLPSHYESFGLAALEAMACGLPVVASRVGGLKEVVRDGLTGYLVPWRCPEPFAQRMEVVLSNADLREAMSRAAVQWARRFSWEAVADRLADLYTGLIDVGWQCVAGG